METKTPVKTYTLDYLCDVCGKELMRPTNRTVLGYPPKFNHTCGACGYSKDFLVRYPCQVFEEMPQLIEELKPLRDFEPRGMTPLEVTERPDTIASMQEKGLIPKPVVKSSPDDVTCYSPQDELDAALSAAMPTAPVPKKKFPKKKAKR